MSDETQTVFDERTLRAAIVSVWGEYGAHADVFDHMLKLCAEWDSLAAQLEAARRAHAELVEVATDLRTDLLDKLEKAQGQSTYASAAAREALWVLDELDLSGCVPRSWSA